MDGSFVAAQMLRERTVIRVPIARELCPGKRTRISILPAVVQVPKLASDSSDERALSIGVHAVALGYDGDLTLVDLKAKRRIENSWIVSKCGWTPFDGQKVTGWPVGTFVRGHRVMWENEIATGATGEAVRFMEA